MVTHPNSFSDLRFYFYFFDLCFYPDKMDFGVEQIDGPKRTSSPGCEQQDARREGEETQRDDRPKVKLPQRSDMICGFASLKGQKIIK